MVYTRNLTYSAALLLLAVLPLALSHGDDHGSGTAATAVAQTSLWNSSTTFTSTSEQSYFAHSEYRGLVLAHIGLMIIAWFFVLPIGGSMCRCTWGFVAKDKSYRCDAECCAVSTCSSRPTRFPRIAKHWVMVGHNLFE